MELEILSIDISQDTIDDEKIEEIKMYGDEATLIEAICDIYEENYALRRYIELMVSKRLIIFDC